MEQEVAGAQGGGPGIPLVLKQKDKREEPGDFLGKQVQNHISSVDRKFQLNSRYSIPMQTKTSPSIL